MLASPVFAILLTLAAYEGARRVWERSGRAPLLNPVLVSIAVIGTVLWAVGVDYERYAQDTRDLVRTFDNAPSPDAEVLP